MNKVSKKVQELMKLVSYNPITGAFRFKKRDCPRFNSRFAGKYAGTISSDGYVVISLKGKVYRANRLAWAFMTGKFPPKSKVIDHIKCKTDNSWDNLRLATYSQNAMNRKLRTTSKTKLIGVSYCEKLGKYKARCDKKGMKQYLSLHDTKMEAAIARDAAARKMHGEFVTLNFSN